MQTSNSSNYRILRSILSKTRRMDFSQDVSYLIIYSFLYKYASDILKDYFLTVTEDKSITLDEAYENEECRQSLRRDALNMFGYFINDSDFFIDDVINNEYSERFFIYEFFTAFSEHVEFDTFSNYEKYFTFIFDAVKSEINFRKFEFEGENHLIVKDIIFSISKLNVMDEEYPFERVFAQICSSALVSADSDPDYVNQMLSEIIMDAKRDAEDIYAPFMNDASSLITLKNSMSWRKSYGKCPDKITYCAAIVKMFLNDFDLDGVFVEFSSPFESAGIGGASFDVIISRIPQLTPKNIKRLNKTQNIQRVKNTKRIQLQNLLTDKFDMSEDSVLSDEVNSAIEDLINKMDLEKDFAVEFEGEYEVLKDSEYLFLINLIASLADDGIMAVSMPQSFLFKNSLETLRKYLTVEINCIDAVISLPDEFSRPKTSDIIVIFRKNRVSGDIVFIDMSKNYASKRLPDAVPGLFKRNMIFSPDTIGHVIDVLNKRKTVDKFSNVVDIGEIEKNEFNLAISRYVDTFEGEFISLRDLKHQKRELDDNLERLNKKIDGMMSDLNIRF